MWLIKLTVRNESTVKAADETAEADDSKYWQRKFIGSEQHHGVRTARAGAMSGYSSFIMQMMCMCVLYMCCLCLRTSVCMCKLLCHCGSEETNDLNSIIQACVWHDNVRCLSTYAAECVGVNAVLLKCELFRQRGKVWRKLQRTQLHLLN